MSGLEPKREAQLTTVIETKHIRGKGTEEDMCRPITRYWSLSGELLAENDPCAKEKE